MSLLLGQILYTSFSDSGFRLIASTNISEEVLGVFLQKIVNKIGDSFEPYTSDERTAYLYQISREQTLFGWLYSDGEDDLGRSQVPLFICHYLTGRLEKHLKYIFNYLERGPIVSVDRTHMPVRNLNTILLPTDYSYKPTYLGIPIAQELRHLSQTILKKEQLLDLCIPSNEQQLNRENSGQNTLKQIKTNHLPNTAYSQLKEPTSLNSPKISEQKIASPCKVALLIGISQCGQGFKPLPGVIQDVKGMEKTLKNSDIGEYEVQTLINPSSQVMVEAIEKFLLDREPDDTAILYFSGYACFFRRQNKIFLTTGNSCRNNDNSVVRSTVISFDFLEDVLANSSSKPLIVLDICLQDASTSKNFITHRAHANLAKKFLSLNQTVLISSEVNQSYGVHKGEELSIYTFYLIEGLKTGAADLNCDGMISAQEWHAYAKERVKRVMPALKPKIYRYGTEMILASSPVLDPLSQYRRAVERLNTNGEISLINRTLLELLQGELKISDNEVIHIEEQVLRPYKDYHSNLKKYAYDFVQVARQNPRISDATQQSLKESQALFGLRDADINFVTQKITKQLALLHSPHTTSNESELKTYRLQETKPFSQKILNQRLNFSRANVTTQLKNWSLKTHHVLHFANLHRWRQFPNKLSFNFRFTNHKIGLVAGVTTIAALVSLVSFRDWKAAQDLKQDQQMLEQTKALANQKDYEACIAQAQAIASDSKLYENTQQLLTQCQAGANWQNTQFQVLPSQSNMRIWSIGFVPNSQTLITGSNDYVIDVWNLGEGKRLQSFQGHQDQVWSVALNQNGDRFASASGDNSIKLWDLKTKQLLKTLLDHKGTVWSVAFSPQDQWIVSGSDDKTIKLWTMTGQLRHTLSGHSDRVRSVAISPDGKLLASGSADKTIKIWNLQTRTLLYTLTGHSNSVTSVAFSPDNQILATGSSDKTIKLWNSKTGKNLHTLNGHTGGVSAIAFSPNGKILASNSKDKTVRLWNPANGQPRQTFKGQQQEGFSMAFSSDGKTLASSGNNGAIQIWHRN